MELIITFDICIHVRTYIWISRTFRFAINLQQDEDPQGGDIAFHFNPRPSQGEVIRNSCTGGDWQDEEKEQPHFPFDDGRSFILRIEVTASEFRTYVNGKPYINYSHRVDLGDVHFLHLTDGAEYYDITFVDRYVSSLKPSCLQNMLM